MIGIVTSRRCPSCGHHEIGLLDKNGDFHPLVPGARVKILGAEPASRHEPTDTSKMPRPSRTQTTLKSWVPDPAKNNRLLGLKYGVMIKKEEMTGAQVDIEVFKSAYIEKLEALIERETRAGVAILLDRFYAAPHLASGSPKDIAHNMWKNLEEIRRPVETVKSWLKNEGGTIYQESLFEERPPQTRTTGYPGLEKELEQLSLEVFLTLL